MPMGAILLVLGCLLTAIATGVVSVFVWRRRDATPAASALTAVMAIITVWSLLDIAYLAPTAFGAPQWLESAALSSLVPVAACLVGAFWLMARMVIDRNWTPSTRTLVVLAVPPVVDLVLIVAGVRPYRFSAADTPWPHVEFTWLFYLLLLFGYLVLGDALRRLGRAWLQAGTLQRGQLAALMVSTLPPFAANVVAVLAPAGSTPDLTGFAFAMTALLDAYAITRLGLTRLVPIARGVVLDHLRDAVIVVDVEGRLLDTNRSAESLVRWLSGSAAPLAGMDVPALLGTMTSAGGAFGERIVSVQDRTVVMDIRYEPLSNRRGSSIGELIVLRDVTEVFELRRHLANLAERDELTGLYNRRYLMRRLTAAIGAALAEDADLAAILIDVDHFKSVNDTYGHGVGDDLLIALAATLSQGLAAEEVLARYGGEEFVLLLPGVSQQDAVRRAQDLRLRCHTLSVPSQDGPVLRTISAGVASIQPLARSGAHTEVTPALMLACADNALYRAKAAGRDQVLGFSASSPVPSARTAATPQTARRPYRHR